MAAPISSAPNKNPSSTPMYYLCVAYTLGPPRPRVDLWGGNPCIRCILFIFTRPFTIFVAEEVLDADCPPKSIRALRVPQHTTAVSPSQQARERDDAHSIECLARLPRVLPCAYNPLARNQEQERSTKARIKVGATDQPGYSLRRFCKASVNRDRWPPGADSRQPWPA